MRTSMKASTPTITFTSNFAEKLGGAFSIGSSFVSDNVVEMSANFTHNEAKCGGAIAVGKERKVTFININIFNNSRSAVCAFKGMTHLFGNSGFSGGGINSNHSNLIFIGNTSIEGNSATFGGAISSIHGIVTFYDFAKLSHNRADLYGGELYALGSNVILKKDILLNSNFARHGGAMYFWSSATLTLTRVTFITSFNNSAKEYGGVIYHKDTPTALQYNFYF